MHAKRRTTSTSALVLCTCSWNVFICHIKQIRPPRRGDTFGRDHKCIIMLYILGEYLRLLLFLLFGSLYAPHHLFTRTLKNRVIVSITRILSALLSAIACFGPGRPTNRVFILCWMIKKRVPSFLTTNPKTKENNVQKCG